MSSYYDDVDVDPPSHGCCRCSLFSGLPGLPRAGPLYGRRTTEAPAGAGVPSRPASHVVYNPPDFVQDNPHYERPTVCEAQLRSPAPVPIVATRSSPLMMV